MDLKTLALLGLGSLVLPACDDEDDTGGESGTPDCEVTVDETVPTDGATDAYYRASVEFHLSDPDPEGDPTATLAGPSGEVAGTTSYSEDMEVVYFTPSSPLAPSTEYSAKLDYCSGEAVISFRTSDLGGELDSALDGRTYLLDLTTARFVEPATVGGLIGEFLTMDILVGVVSAVPGSTLDMMGAVSVEGSEPPVQDFCTTTIAFPQADFTDAPYFEVGPADTTVTAAGYAITIHGLDISGTFAADGSYFGGGKLAGMIDARDLVGVLPKVETADDVCVLLATFGAPCVACDYTGGDGAEYCLGLVADQILALELAGTTLEEVELDNCHELCKDTSGCP